MGRPTKAEQKAKQKAKEEEIANKAKENAKAQEELLKKAEERNKKRAEEIALKNKSKGSDVKTEPIENNIVSQQKTESNSSMEEIQDHRIEDVSNIDSNNKTEENTSHVDEVEAEYIPDITSEMDIPEEIIQEMQNQTSEDFVIPDDDFDPLKEKVIKRSYTDGNLGSTQEQSTLIDVNNSGDGKSTNQSNQTSEPAQQTVIEPVISEPVIKTIDQNVSIEIDEILNGEKTSNTSSSETSQKTEKQKTSVNSNLEDLSPSQKRKAAEKTADALITTYTNLVPIPFKAISSFNMRKLEARHLKDEIDMHMQIIEDGTKIVDYCEKVNEQVDQTFVITKQMQDEIRDPLIDVLLENNFALTPTQRLIMVVGGQIVQMGITAVQFMQQNKNAMDTFKKFHEENKSNINTTQNHENQQNVNVQDTTVESNTIVEKNSDVTSEKSNIIDIPDDNEVSSEDKITVEEYLEKD